MTASRDNTAKIWDSFTGKIIGELKGHTDIVNIALFSSEGDMIITASHDNTIKLWDANKCQIINELVGHTGTIISVIVSKDRKIILTKSLDNTARIWDTNSGKIIAVIGDKNFPVYDAEFSPDEKPFLHFLIIL